MDQSLIDLEHTVGPRRFLRTLTNEIVRVQSQHAMCQGTE